MENVSRKEQRVKIASRLTNIKLIATLYIFFCRTMLLTPALNDSVVIMFIIFYTAFIVT